MLFGGRKRCIVCGGSGSGDLYVSYRILDDANKMVGKMDVHKQPQCFMSGSQIIKRQQEQAIDAPYIESTSRVDGKKYTFVLVRKNNYYVIPLYATTRTSKGPKYELRKDTYKFLQDFIRSDSLVAIFIRALKNTPEAHIPLLAHMRDPVIPRDLLESPDYKRRKIAAITQMKTSTEIRGGDRIQEAQIMYQYLQDTAILV